MTLSQDNCIILGIDPGSRITGYGIIQVTGNQHSYIASGCIRTQGVDMAPRLQQIFKNLSEIMVTYQPHEIAIEQVFVQKNVSSALKLGQARGAAIVAAGDRALFEYSARQIKQAIVGYGAAEKAQIQQMIKALLNLSGLPQADAADALAIAMCHAQSRAGARFIAPAAASMLRGVRTLRRARGRLR